MDRAMENRVSRVVPKTRASGGNWINRFLAISLATGLILGVPAVTPLAEVARANPGLLVQDLNTLTANQVANALVGSGITISNVSYTGAAVASGTFSGGTGIIGFDTGIVLTSGDVDNVVGPNLDDGITGTNGVPGDGDLDLLVPGTIDASVLEFDFVPTENAVSFNYVFASDEYNEFVNSGFNDVFAFFVNGVNCALVNGDPVSINNVNGGNPFGTNASNPELFRNNDPNDPGPATIDTEMDGLTVVLPCEAAVNPNVTNHLKLAIADVGDTSLDSAVFIQAGSLEAVPEADLQVTKTADPAGDVQPGDTITYTVTVQNNGPDEATGVLLTDTITGPATLDSGSFGIESSCSIIENIAECDIGTLAPDSSIDVTIMATAGDEGPVVNTAVVSGDVVDPDDSNDQASTSNEVVAAATADLSIDKDDDPGPDPAPGGSDVTYTISVTNHSEGTTATGVTITDDPPAGASLAAGSDECWSDVEGLFCDVGTLEPGATATRTLVLTMPVVEEQTTFVNTASVSGDQVDPDLEDNSDSAETDVHPENEVNNLQVTTGDTVSLSEGDASVQLIVGDVGNAQIDMALVPPDEDPVCETFPCQSEVLFWNWDSFDQSADSTLIFDTGELEHRLQKRLWRLVPMFYEKDGEIQVLPRCSFAERVPVIPDRPCEENRQLGDGFHLIVTILMTPEDPKSFR